MKDIWKKRSQPLLPEKKGRVNQVFLLDLVLITRGLGKRKALSTPRELPEETTLFVADQGSNGIYSLPANMNQLRRATRQQDAANKLHTPAKFLWNCL